MGISKFKREIATLLLIMGGLSLHGQENQEIADFSSPEDYIIGGVTTRGGSYAGRSKIMATGSFFRCQDNHYKSRI